MRKFINLVIHFAFNLLHAISLASQTFSMAFLKYGYHCFFTCLSHTNISHVPFSFKYFVFQSLIVFCLQYSFCQFLLICLKG